MTEYVIDVPMPPAAEWLTSNKTSRYRWGSGAWRNAAAAACRAAGVPYDALITPVRIVAVAYYIGRAPVRDDPNLYPTIKAAVDGLTPLRYSSRKGKIHTRGGYGLIPDDSREHVHSLTWTVEKSQCGYPLLRITVTEVDPA